MPEFWENDEKVASPDSEWWKQDDVKPSTATATTVPEFQPTRAPAFYPGREGEGGLYTPRGQMMLPAQAAAPGPSLLNAPKAAFRDLGRGVAHISTKFGDIAEALATDIGSGAITRGAPNTLAVFMGTPIQQATAETLPARIAVGTVRGAGEMVPALAVSATGVGMPVAFGAQMGLRAYGETGDAAHAARQAAVGALLGKASQAGAILGEAAGVRIAAQLPAALENATVTAARFAGQQVSLNALMTAGSLPELVAAWREQPGKAVSLLAEQIGINLAFSAPHIPQTIRDATARNVSEAFVRSPEYRQWLDQAVRSAGVPEQARGRLPDVTPLRVAADNAAAEGAPATAEAVRAQAELLPKESKAIESVPGISVSELAQLSELRAKRDAGRLVVAEQTTLRSLEAQEAMSKISPPAATPASTPPVVDAVAEPSATRTPEAAAVEVGDTITAKSHQITGLTHIGKVVSVRGDEIGMVNEDYAPVLVLRKNVQNVVSSATRTPEAAAVGTANIVKEPWQMPRNDFVRLNKKIDAQWQETKQGPSKFGDFRDPADYRDYMDQVREKAYAMSYLEAMHRSEIKAALRNGKPVPPEVLADYPDLKPVEAPKPKWTSATADVPPLGGATYGPFGIPDPVATVRAVIRMAKDAAPHLKSAAQFVVNTGREAIGDLSIQKLNDRRGAVFNWSAKLQQSFGEAAEAQRDIQKRVPDPVRRAGITNWIQADGDLGEITRRFVFTRDPELKAGYEAAMNLTPEELVVARDVKAAYDALGKRGQQFGVLNSFIDNYVTQIWDMRKGPAIGSSRTLKDQFRFAKARTFDTFFRGEQAGFQPKTKDISKLLPVYLHEMNSVIAARQLVAQMSDGVASDGRPLVAASGAATAVDGPQGQAVLVMPKKVKGDTADYKRLENQPAFNDWIWAGKDTDGNPVFLKSDLKLHPEAYAQLANVLGKSEIRKWYENRTTLTAEIPKVIVKAIDALQAETKRTMLGFFAPFHQVQEGTHAVGHRVNPFFNNPKIDLVNKPEQMDAARHGLMLLPDRVSANNFMEGFRTSGLVSKIPGIGPAADWYSHYLFHDYIPGIKFKTYEAILERNTKVYEKDLARGEVTVEDVKALSATQANAAYGHLNYADLARNPTIQHIMRLGLLAPDFLEARARFFGQALKGVTGAKVGREQLLALATLALAQATLAYTAAKTTDGEWDGSRPFEFTKDGRRYTMRSVPEDFVSFTRDIGHVFDKGGETPFISHRLSPLVGRGSVQLLTGRDYRGRQVTPLETVGELSKTPIPLTLRGAAGELPWVGDFLKPNTSLSIPEQLWSAVGIKISVDRPEKPEKPKREKPVYKP